MKNPKNYDYDVLESYWHNYPAFIHTVSSERSRAELANMQRIIDCIEQQFHEADEEMQGIMRMVFWQSDDMDDEDDFPISRSKLNDIKTRLLKDTAERLEKA